MYDLHLYYSHLKPYSYYSCWHLLTLNCIIPQFSIDINSYTLALFFLTSLLEYGKFCEHNTNTPVLIHFTSFNPTFWSLSGSYSVLISKSIRRVHSCLRYKKKKKVVWHLSTSVSVITSFMLHCWLTHHSLIPLVGLLFLCASE